MEEERRHGNGEREREKKKHPLVTISCVAGISAECVCEKINVVSFSIWHINLRSQFTRVKHYLPSTLAHQLWIEFLAAVGKRDKKNKDETRDKDQ